MSKPLTREQRYPKSIGITKNGKFRVSFTAKKEAISDKKSIHVGTFPTLEEAIKQRDAFIIANYNGVAKGYMPRGISFFKRNNTYQAHLSIDGITFYIGTYKNMTEAIEARNKYIDSLK